MEPPDVHSLPRVWAPLINAFLGLTVAVLSAPLWGLDSGWAATQMAAGVVISMAALSSHMLSREEGGVWPSWLDLLVGASVVGMGFLAWSAPLMRVDVFLGIAVMLTAVVTMVEHRQHLRLTRYP